MNPVIEEFEKKQKVCDHEHEELEQLKCKFMASKLQQLSDLLHEMKGIIDFDSTNIVLEERAAHTSLPKNWDYTMF